MKIKNSDGNEELVIRLFYLGVGDIWRLYFDKFGVIFTSVIIDFQQ